MFFTRKIHPGPTPPRAVGEQHRPDFSRSWSRADDVRCLCRRRRCRVALIITGGRFRPRCYISTVFIVCGWAITSPRHRDTGVERAFSSASGMGARHRAISPSRRRLWWRRRVMSSKAFCVWLLEGQLSGRFPGQLLPRGPRPAASTRAITSCVTRCVAAAWLELDDPPTAVHPHATSAALSHPHRSLASRPLQNYGRGSTTSRRAHAAAIISAPPRTARTAASCAHALRPRLRGAAVVLCVQACSGLLASGLGWAEPGRAVLSDPAGDGRAEPP